MHAIPARLVGRLEYSFDFLKIDSKKPIDKWLMVWEATHKQHETLFFRCRIVTWTWKLCYHFNSETLWLDWPEIVDVCLRARASVRVCVTEMESRVVCVCVRPGMSQRHTRAHTHTLKRKKELVVSCVLAVGGGVPPMGVRAFINRSFESANSTKTFIHIVYFLCAGNV